MKRRCKYFIPTLENQQKQFNAFADHVAAEEFDSMQIAEDFHLLRNHMLFKESQHRKTVKQLTPTI